MIASTRFHIDERERRLRMRTPGSRERYQRALKTLAGGVSTSMRRSARPYPLYFDHGRGARIVDVDGNSYLDYCLAWGPLILGHTPEEVLTAVGERLRSGFTFGAQHDLEYQVAEKLVRIIPCADMVCFANSGTEIVQLALRLARAVTGRQRFVKFEGHYHGWDDSVLVSYHPPLEAARKSGDTPVAVGLGQRQPSTALVAEWNDRAGVERLFEEYGGEIGALICEPLLANTGSIPPEPGFLEFLREITHAHRALLIFDEVITGFRLGLSGAQGYYGVTPDLATYAKAVGGGAPLSVLAGKAELMELIANGSVVHAGTLNGNPVALAAANATLDVLSRDGGRLYDDLWRRGEWLRSGLERALKDARIPVVASGGGPAFSILFMHDRPRSYRETLGADAALYSDFGLALLEEGVMVLPDGRWYLSLAHSDEVIEETLAAAGRALSGEVTLTLCNP